MEVRVVDVAPGCPATVAGSRSKVVRSPGCGTFLADEVDQGEPLPDMKAERMYLIPLYEATSGILQSFADMARLWPGSVMLVAQDGRIGMYCDDGVDVKKEA